MSKRKSRAKPSRVKTQKLFVTIEERCAKKAYKAKERAKYRAQREAGLLPKQIKKSKKLRHILTPLTDSPGDDTTLSCVGDLRLALNLGNGARWQPSYFEE